MKRRKNSSNSFRQSSKLRTHGRTGFPFFQVTTIYTRHAWQYEFVLLRYFSSVPTSSSATVNTPTDHNNSFPIQFSTIFSCWRIAKSKTTWWNSQRAKQHDETVKEQNNMMKQSKSKTTWWNSQRASLSMIRAVLLWTFMAKRLE
jgi:predicted glycosyl hydrolase (DUF1957 family)